MSKLPKNAGRAKHRYGLLVCAVCLLHFQGMGKNVTRLICSFWEERQCVMKHEVCCITATSLPLFYTNLIQLLNFFPALRFVLCSLVEFYLQLKEPLAWFSWGLLSECRNKQTSKCFLEVNFWQLHSVQVTEEMETALCKWGTSTPLCDLLFGFPDDSSQSVLQACTYWVHVHWIFSLITTKMLVCSCMARGSFRYASAVRKYVVIKLEETWRQLAPGSLLQGCLIISFFFFFP